MMRLDSNRECNVCEVSGECWGTPKECDVYHEFYGMEETKAVKVQLADGPAIFTDSIHYTNKGIINRLTGRIVNVVQGDIMALLTIEIGPDNYISSMMPIEKFLESRKKTGDLVTTVFKAVNVMIML